MDTRFIWAADGWKKKSNDEVIKIVEITLSSTGEFVTWADSKGDSHSCSLKTFKRKFYNAELDYNSYKDNIVELCYQCQDFSRLGKIVMKRLDPDYFKVGDVVYIDPFYRSFIDCSKSDHYSTFGPTTPFVIGSIINVKSDRGYRHDLVGEIRIIQKNKYVEGRDYTNSYDYDYSIPIYYTFPRIGDAYWVLCRYDKLY